MALAKEVKAQIIKDFGGNAKNTGATSVQIAILTKEIEALNAHLSTNIHDFGARRGLLTKVGQRRNLLRYLESKNLDEYKSTCEKLGLRY